LQDYDAAHDEHTLLRAYQNNSAYTPILMFAERSSEVLQQYRTRVIRERHVSSAFIHTMFVQLPAAAAAAPTPFLKKNIPQPAATHVRRRVLKKSRRQQTSLVLPDDGQPPDPPPPLRPVHVTVDMFAARGGRHQLPVAKLVRRLQSDGARRPGVVVVAKGLGFRSSKAAGGLTAVFEDKRADRRDATIADLPRKWSASAPPPVPHHHQYDEVLGCIQQRDQIVFHALNVKRMAKDLGVEEPIAFQRHFESPKKKERAVSVTNVSVLLP
jgi:hypothetical protein